MSAGLYVGAVAALAARAFWSPDAGFTWGEGAALLLTVPVIIPALPLIYVVGAGIWNVTEAGDGGPMWPVTVVYTLMFAAVAVGNVWLARVLLRWRHLRRTRKPASRTCTRHA